MESYIQVESGESGIEDWGVLLARVAVVLSTPMSRLIPAAGASVDATRHSVGALVCEARKRRNLTEEHLARRLGLSTDAYRRVEGGLTPIEHWSRAAHRYAELVEQPVFNLFAAALTSHEMPRRAAAR